MLTEKLQATQIYKKINESDKRIILNIGGAGSSKSYSIAQWLIIERLLKPNHRILITRKTTPSLRLSCYLLIKDIMTQLNIPIMENRSEMMIQLGTSMMVFKGLDDPSKIRSFDVDTIWGEEATELQYNDFSHLNLTLRWDRAGGDKKFLLSLNPTDENHWIKKKLIDTGRQDIETIYSTYKDNPFLQKDYKDELESLKDQDKNFYNIYTLGRWGALEHRIYSNFDVIDKLPEGLGEPVYGLDFGWTNPTALIEIYFNGDDIYAVERLHQSNMSTSDIITALDNILPDKARYIWADSEDPRAIEEIYRAGFNIHPAIKGPDSVVYGINTVKRHKIHIIGSSVNLIKEINGYSWKTDKNGDVVSPPSPVKFSDHCLDSLRYGVTGWALKMAKNANDWIFSKI